MNYFKNFFKSIIYFIAISLILTLLVTIFSYFDIFNENIIKVLKLLSPIISIFIGGFTLGKKSSKNGYLEGIKIASFITIILLLFSIVFNIFKFESLIYYLILFISSILGSIIGIQKKLKNN